MLRLHASTIPQSPPEKLPLEEQLVIFEDWVLGMYYSISSPLED